MTTDTVRKRILQKPPSSRPLQEAEQDGIAERRPEDRALCVCVEMGVIAVPEPHQLPRVEAPPPARPAAVMLGVAYQVRAEPLSRAVSAHYPTHLSCSPARTACPQLCQR